MNFLIGIFLAFIVLSILITKGMKKAFIPLLILNIISTFLAVNINYYFGKPSTNYLNALPHYLNLAFLIIIITNRNYSQEIFKGKFSFPIIIYILWFFIFSFLGSGSISSSYKGTICAPILMTFYFYALIYFNSEKSIKIFFQIFIAIFLINVFYALYQQIFGLPEALFQFAIKTTYLGRGELFDPYLNREYYRVSGFSSCLYDFFYVASMLLIIIISSWDYFKKFFKTSLLFIYCSFYLILLALSLERGPIAMLFVLPIAFINRKKLLILSFTIIIITLITLASYSYYLQMQGSIRLTRFAQLSNPFSEETTLYGRSQTHWKDATALIKDNPFGIGAMEGFELGPHNNYLLVPLQAGWLIGLYFIFILIAVVKYIFKTARTIKDNHFKNLVLGILGATIGVIIMGIPNVPFQGNPGLFVWLFLGLVEKICEIDRKYENYGHNLLRE